MDEDLRKIAHLLFGLLISALLLSLEESRVLVILGSSVFTGLALSDAISRGYRIPLVSQIVERLERKEVLPGKGALFFAVSALICLIIFDPFTAFLGVLLLSVLDSTTTLVGMHVGRHRVFMHRTLEGTLAGIAAGTLSLLLFIGPTMAFLLSCIAGTVELLSPIDDNLTIPVAVCIVWSIIGLVF